MPLAADTSWLRSHGRARSRRALGVFDQRRNRLWEVGGDLRTDCRTERTRRRAAYLHPVDDPPLAFTRRFDAVKRPDDDVPDRGLVDEHFVLDRLDDAQL